jgi:hypothetical protein
MGLVAQAAAQALGWDMGLVWDMGLASAVERVEGLVA